jgi:sensor c-di-GMP phosphodiesterase-like protein
MILKVGLIALALFSGGVLYMLDFLYNQDQRENSEQLRSFVRLTTKLTMDQNLEKEKIKMQLMTEIAQCQKEAMETHNAYVALINRVAFRNNDSPDNSTEIVGQAATILNNQVSKCKKAYDARLLDDK